MTPQSQISDPFEPCASTASLFLFAQGPVILSLHHDTLAVERRFTRHSENIDFISVDNVSERGAGRLVVSYDVGQTAIVWDLFTGSEISRFASFDHLRVAAWMRNGTVAFGNGKGEIILFEPSTSEHKSILTISDPITALAPLSDCQTHAIGYQNGSILLATLQPSFTILHALTMPRDPSPVVGLAWHASSSKQKSDMLATQADDGDLRIWSVSKPPGSDAPRVIRALRRSEIYSLGPKWIAWSKNGRVVQYMDKCVAPKLTQQHPAISFSPIFSFPISVSHNVIHSLTDMQTYREIWAWDVRTKRVTYEPIPTIDDVRGVANYGPTASLFTLGPNHTVQQYDLEYLAMVANVQHLPVEMPPQLEAPRRASNPTPALQPPADIKDDGPGTRQKPHEVDPVVLTSDKRAPTASPGSTKSRTNSMSSGTSSGAGRGTFSPISKSGRSGTTFSLTSGGNGAIPRQSSTSIAYTSSISTSSGTGNRSGSRLKNEVFRSPVDQPLDDLFPFIRARLNDVPYKQQPALNEAHLTADDLRRRMLSVVFGWDNDIEELIRAELDQHAPNSRNAILLSRWLGNADPDQMMSMMSSGSISTTDWMLLALSQMSGQAQSNKIGQAFVQKLLESGDIHTSATVLLGLGDRNDAIEVYVSRNRFLEAVLMTCLLMPSDWQRLSYLVRRWGENVVQESQQLAIRCFICTGAEPSDPWTSPSAPQVDTFANLHEQKLSIDTSTEKNQSHSGSQPQPPNSSSRLTVKNSPLKLITSFGPQANPSFRFPGLRSDDGTPTNAPGITPIAESAVGESAFSPGGLGTFMPKSARSLDATLSARTVTPGGYARRRLPSIGETPIDVQPPAFPPPKSLPTPVDSGSDKEKTDKSDYDDGARNNHAKDAPRQDNNTQEEPMLLLPSVRYEPGKEAIDRSPQTAVKTTPQENETTGRSSSPPVAVLDIKIESPGVSNGFQSQSDVQSNNLFRHVDYSSADTGGPHSQTPLQYQSDATSGARSPASTLNSYKSMKSPSISGRSLDQYISSLDEASYYAKHRAQTPRGRRNTDTEGSGRGPRRQRSASREARGRTNDRAITPAPRSPSSPVFMSLDKFSRYNTSTDSFEGTYGARSDISKPRSRSKLRNENSRIRTSSSTAERRHRHPSKHKGSSRNRSRQRSRDPSGRNRSSERDAFASTLPAHPSSPPQDNDVRLEPHFEESLRLVSIDRERRQSRQRSSSRRPERGTSARREASPDRRLPRQRSRSRQPREHDVSSRRGFDEPTRERSIDSRWQIPSDGVSGSESRRPPPGLRAAKGSALERTRKELAAAELEARRLSLARRPSAPNIPLPGEVHHTKSASDSPPFTVGSFNQRAQTKSQTGTNNSSPEYPNSSDSGSSKRSSGVPIGLPATPKAMRLPKYSGDLPSDAPAVPEIPRDRVASPDSMSPDQAERVGRSRYGPIEKFEIGIPADLPAHPYYKPEIPRSRSTSRTRFPGHYRQNSRDLGVHGSPTYGSSPSITVSIEETLANSMQERGSNEIENPPLIPELQHLSNPPPPPPAPGSREAQSPQNSTGTIDIAIDNDILAKSFPRAMTAAPTMTADSRPSREQRRMSFDHRRGRSINESFASKIRNFTERMRSTSRNRLARSPPVDSPEQVSPYESVQISSYDNRI
ncbi:hypothetical protein Plec18167_000542 [Paecilomyces lecythidis]|uniref:Gem-associated protein 5 TPR domain-containing protein n=1 Tax=Paecilomyces lecythidis TaxID=3004212 RepID=A0ABR3YF12_9EURO